MSGRMTKKSTRRPKRGGRMTKRRSGRTSKPLTARRRHRSHGALRGGMMAEAELIEYRPTKKLNFVCNPIGHAHPVSFVSDIDTFLEKNKPPIEVGMRLVNLKELLGQEKSMETTAWNEVERVWNEAKTGADGSWSPWPWTFKFMRRRSCQEGSLCPQKKEKQHKVKFAHPDDADWVRGPCYVGSRCSKGKGSKKKQQHKQDFSHPGDDDWVRRPCKFGSRCREKDVTQHTIDFPHPGDDDYPPETGITGPQGALVAEPEALAAEPGALAAEGGIATKEAAAEAEREAAKEARLQKEKEEAAKAEQEAEVAKLQASEEAKVTAAAAAKAEQEAAEEARLQKEKEEGVEVTKPGNANEAGAAGVAEIAETVEWRALKAGLPIENHVITLDSGSGVSLWDPKQLLGRDLFSDGCELRDIVDPGGKRFISGPWLEFNFTQLIGLTGGLSIKHDPGLVERVATAVRWHKTAEKQTNKRYADNMIEWFGKPLYMGGSSAHIGAGGASGALYHQCFKGLMETHMDTGKPHGLVLMDTDDAVVQYIYALVIVDLFTLYKLRTLPADNTKTRDNLINMYLSTFHDLFHDDDKGSRAPVGHSIPLQYLEPYTIKEDSRGNLLGGSMSERSKEKGSEVSDNFKQVDDLLLYIQSDQEPDLKEYIIQKIIKHMREIDRIVGLVKDIRGPELRRELQDMPVETLLERAKSELGDEAVTSALKGAHKKNKLNKLIELLTNEGLIKIIKADKRIRYWVPLLPVAFNDNDKDKHVIPKCYPKDTITSIDELKQDIPCTWILHQIGPDFSTKQGGQPPDLPEMLIQTTQTWSNLVDFWTEEPTFDGHTFISPIIAGGINGGNCGNEALARHYWAPASIKRIERWLPTIPSKLTLGVPLRRRDGVVRDITQQEVQKSQLEQRQIKLNELAMCCEGMRMMRGIPGGILLKMFTNEDDGEGGEVAKELYKNVLTEMPERWEDGEV